MNLEGRIWKICFVRSAFDREEKAATTTCHPHMLRYNNLHYNRTWKDDVIIMRFRRKTSKMSIIQHMVTNTKPSQVGNRRNTMFLIAFHLRCVEMKSARGCVAKSYIRFSRGRELAESEI